MWILAGLWRSLTVVPSHSRPSPPCTKPWCNGFSRLGNTLPGAGGEQGSWYWHGPQHHPETLSFLPKNTTWNKREVFPVIISEYSIGSKMYLCSHKNLQTRQILFYGGSLLNYFRSRSRNRSRSFSFGFATGETLSSREQKDGTRMTMIPIHVPAVLRGCKKNAILILRLHTELCFCWMGSESSWCKTSELMETMHCSIPSPVRGKWKDKMFSILWHSFSELQQILWW